MVKTTRPFAKRKPSSEGLLANYCLSRTHEYNDQRIFVRFDSAIQVDLYSRAYRHQLTVHFKKCGDRLPPLPELIFFVFEVIGLLRIEQVGILFLKKFSLAKLIFFYKRLNTIEVLNVDSSILFLG